jgi:asparagine synthetase B (glutamine-hydrolysing)
MCGIFGFAGFEKPDLLSRMAASVRYRGPEGEGYCTHGCFLFASQSKALLESDDLDRRPTGRAIEGCLARRQGKNSMAHSLEQGCPFLDQRMLEQAFRMPRRAKVHGLRDKWIECWLGCK